MHEMAIAEGIVDVALDTLKVNQGSVIHAIQVQIGVLSGVEPDALHFCFDAVTQGTPAEGATLEVETIPMKGRCMDCDQEFSIQDYRHVCPHCHSFAVEELQGRELRVASIDMD